MARAEPTKGDDTAPLVPPPLGYAGLGDAYSRSGIPLPGLTNPFDALGRQLDGTFLLGGLKDLAGQTVQDVGDVAKQFIPGDPFGVNTPIGTYETYVNGKYQQVPYGRAAAGSNNLAQMMIGGPEMKLAEPFIADITKQAVNRGLNVAGRAAGGVERGVTQGTGLPPIAGMGNANPARVAAGREVGKGKIVNDPLVGAAPKAAEAAPKSVEEALASGFSTKAYHGSPDFVGESFSPEFQKLNTGVGRGGFSFTENMAAAEAYKGKLSVGQVGIDDITRKSNAVLRSKADAVLRSDPELASAYSKKFETDPGVAVEFDSSFTESVKEARAWVKEQADWFAANGHPDVGAELNAAAASSTRQGKPRLITAYLRNPEMRIENGDRVYTVKNPNDIFIEPLGIPKAADASPQNSYAEGGTIGFLPEQMGEPTQGNEDAPYLDWLKRLIGPAATGRAAKGPGDIPVLGGPLQALDAAVRVGFDAPAGMAGIGLQKLAEFAGGGRGREEEAVTSAVSEQTKDINGLLKPLATAFLYPAAASEAMRVSANRDAEAGRLPSVETPIGRFNAYDIATMALPVGGLAELGLRGAAKAGATIPSKLSSVAARAGGRDAATAGYRAEQAANRLEELTRNGVSRQSALSQVAKEFPNVREGDVAGMVAGRANQAAERAAQGLARSQAGDLAQAVGYTGDLSTGGARVGAGAARQAAAVAYDIDQATGRSVDNVVQFPGSPTDSSVAGRVASPGPVEAIPGEVGVNLGEALAKAAASKQLRMQTLTDKVVRGEPVRAVDVAELMDYLKQVAPDQAVEIDRILSPSVKAEAETVRAIEKARLESKAARGKSSLADRQAEAAHRRLDKANESVGQPEPFTVVGGGPSGRLATPAAATAREAGAPLDALGQRLNDATDAVKTGYSQIRDEQILRDATINTGKIDDPGVAAHIAQTIRENPEGFARATRSVPFEETLAKSADYLGVEVVELQKELARRGFTAGENSAFLTGVNGTLARLGQELHAASAVSDLAYATAEARFLSFARSVGGANSEAGRTLNSLRLQRPLAFINAQYASDLAKTAAKNLERAAKNVENANLSGRSAAHIFKVEQELKAAQEAYGAALTKATTLGEQARSAAIIAADAGKLGQNARKYIATLDPTDIDTMIAVIKEVSSPTKMDKAVSIINIPKTLKSTLDFSAPFRQGLVLSAAHPLSAARSVKDMFRATFKEKDANRMLNEMLVGEGSARRRAAGVYVGDWRKGPLTNHEEAFMSTALNNIPVFGGAVQATERAYTMYLNKLRVDVFDNAVAAWDKVGLKNRPNEEKGLASFVNWATGRGSLGPLNSSAPLLNGLFFSPRFAVSRLQTPLAPLILAARGQNAAAKLAAADLVKFVGAGLSVLTLAKMGGAVVEDDPRSSSFGKIQIGPHLVEIWGGFQQNARYTAQFITGQTKSAAGQIVDMGTNFSQDSRYDLALRYLRNKAAPLPGGVANLMSGENIIGEPNTPQSVVTDLGAPLGWNDVLSAIKADKESALRGAVIGSLALVGISLDSRDPSKEDIQVQIAKKARLDALLTTPEYQRATPEEQKKMADKNISEAGTLAKLTYNINVIKSGNPSETLPAVINGMKAAGDNLRSAGVIGAAQQAGKLTSDLTRSIDAERKQTDRAKPNYDPTVAEYLKLEQIGAKWLSSPEFIRGNKQEWDAAALAASRLRVAIAVAKVAGKDPMRDKQIQDLYRDGADRNLSRYYDRNGSKKSEMVSRERRDLENDPLWTLISGSAHKADHP